MILITWCPNFAVERATKQRQQCLANMKALRICEITMSRIYTSTFQHIKINYNFLATCFVPFYSSLLHRPHAAFITT